MRKLKKFVENKDGVIIGFLVIIIAILITSLIFSPCSLYAAMCPPPPDEEEEKKEVTDQDRLDIMFEWIKWQNFTGPGTPYVPTVYDFHFLVLAPGEKNLEFVACDPEKSAMVMATIRDGNPGDKYRVIAQCTPTDIVHVDVVAVAGLNVTTERSPLTGQEPGLAFCTDETTLIPNPPLPALPTNIYDNPVTAGLCVFNLG